MVNSYMNAFGLDMASLASVPNLGAGDHSVSRNDHSRQKYNNPKELEAANEITRSLFIYDDSANPHPRFPTLMKNIRQRRTEKVNIQVPIFKDINTNF